MAQLSVLVLQYIAYILCCSATVHYLCCIYSAVVLQYITYVVYTLISATVHYLCCIYSD